MKNIHLLPTENPSRLFKDDFGRLIYSINIDQEQNHFEPQNLYITSDEEIKKGDWFLTDDKRVEKDATDWRAREWHRKIILTTDQDLIQDGVQSIDDEFLEWFVKNPSCQEVEVKKWSSLAECGYSYHITIPKEEPKLIHEKIIELCGGEERFKEICGLKPKQETTLEETWELAKKLFKEKCEYEPNLSNSQDLLVVSSIQEGIIKGAKWQQERMYSEEEVLNIQEKYNEYIQKNFNPEFSILPFKVFFEQFKKK